MSPSKKANKKETTKESKNAQEPQENTSARSLRVVTKKPQPKTGKTAGEKKTPARTNRLKSAHRKTKSKAVQEPVQIENLVPIQEQANTDKPKTTLQTNILRVLALLAVIGITVYIYSIRGRVEEFKQFGYIGIFMIALMANATVLLPAPGVAIIYAMGAVFNPLWVGLAAGTGSC